MGSHVGHPEILAHLAPIASEVVRVAPGSCRGREDHHLLAEVRHRTARRQHLDGEPGKRQGAQPSRRLSDWNPFQSVTRDPYQLAVYGDGASAGVSVDPPETEQF